MRNLVEHRQADDRTEDEAHVRQHVEGGQLLFLAALQHAAGDGQAGEQGERPVLDHELHERLLRADEEADALHGFVNVFEVVEH